MKRNWKGLLAVAAALALAAAIGLTPMTAGASAQAPASDPSPAIYVAQRNANSVVGIVTSEEFWNRNLRQIERTAVASGSGVVYREGGYILTNEHVLESGSGFQVLLPSGALVDATLVGSDPVFDIAILKVDEADAEGLVPVEIGSTGSLLPGSTVVAIGNPGGEDLANTLTQGIVSALDRNTVSPSRSGDGARIAERATSYIQHDAALNPGNSGGGLFDYRGALVGINNWKIAGSYGSRMSAEGLGFAIPVETAVRIGDQLIEYGKVVRPAMGVTVSDYFSSDGPDEPLNNYPPKSVMIYSVREGGPSDKAGVKAYDFIYAVNGVRVTATRELTTELDKFAAGDTVTVTLVRYKNVRENETPETVDMYGNRSGGGMEAPTVSGGFEFVDVEIILEVLEP